MDRDLLDEDDSSLEETEKKLQEIADEIDNGELDPDHDLTWERTKFDDDYDDVDWDGGFND